MKKFANRILVILLVLPLITGCYWNQDVRTDQVGAALYRNAVQECKGPGVWSDGRWFGDLQTISLATITFEVEDPEVATQDNQLVGAKITIQARRKGDCDSVKGILGNWSHLLDDAQLQNTIDATAREALKNGTRGFTLTALLDDRNKLSEAIEQQLRDDAGKYFTEIINVTIENIAIDPEYAGVLQATAKLKADEDYQRRRQALIEQTAKTDLFERQQQQLVLAEQLKVEQAQTNVQVEIARRAGEVVKASNEVYAQNPQAFVLEKLRLLQKIFNDKTVFFIPEDADLTFLLDLLEGKVTPLPLTPGQ